MAKVDPDFPHEMFRFLHKPLRKADSSPESRNFLERFVFGPQRQFEQAYARINDLPVLWDPAKTPVPRLLKDIVGFTKELDAITDDISDADLRKLIQLAVPLWKQKGLEIGYINIVRLFTGKNARAFNWFDFRYIVGEQSFAQEELGEDAWLISAPGVEASDSGVDVVGLWPLEQNFLDRSLYKNSAIMHGGPIYFYTLGPLTGSDYYLHMPAGSVLEMPNTKTYDLTGSFTFEFFCRTSVSQDGVIFRRSDGTKTIEISFDSVANEITYLIDDGITQLTETLGPGVDMDDNAWRHLALILNRSEGTVRLYYDGDQASTGLAIGALGDMSMVAPTWVGGGGLGVDPWVGDLDAIRFSIAAKYDLTQASIPVPANAFVEYQAEQLDEFFTDIRLVDDGSLNRTLVKRILNLMRPPSERLRLIYVKFYESFTFGKGSFTTISPGASVVSQELVMPVGSIEYADATGSSTYKDIVLQARVKSTGTAGLRFLIQDDQNYYGFRSNVATQELELVKVVAGVETQLGSTATEEIYADVFYIFTVITDFNDITGETLIKTFVDGNLIHQETDSTFEDGTWGLESIAGTMNVSHVEMFTMPLETDTIKPNAVI